jgi:hypothetical protein
LQPVVKNKIESSRQIPFKTSNTTPNTMKNQIKSVAIGIATALAVQAVTFSIHAGVQATQGQGTSWLGIPDIVINSSPSVNTVAENEYSTNSPNPPLNLAQSFTVTNSTILTNIQIFVSGAAVSNNIHLYDLGIPSGSNPATYTAGTDLFSAGLGFQYGGGGAQVLNLRFFGSDAMALTAGHQYVFEVVPQTDNALTWYRSSSDVYAAGEAYRVGSLLNGIHDDFAMAVTYFTTNVPPPPTTNFWVTVSAYPMTNAWPGSPMIQTFPDPTQVEDLNSAGTGVPEGFGPSSDANGPGRVIGQAFLQTNKSFRLGAVSIKMRGNGGSNVVFFLSLYHLTNNAFMNTNAANQLNRYPFNYQPSQDAEPLGQSMFGSNYVGCRITSANILPGVASGVSNQLLTFTFTDPRAQVLLPSCGTAVNAGTNAIYAFEIFTGTNQLLPPDGLNPTNWAANPWPTNYAADGVFQWIRGIAANSSFEKTCYSAPPTGAGRWRNEYLVGFLAYPRAYQCASYSNYNNEYNLSPSDPRCVRGPISGDIRDFVMAVYAAPPRITGVTNAGAHSFALTLQPSIDGTTFTVQKKTNLFDASWTTLTTGYPAGGVPINSSVNYTDTTATAAQSFYRITSP